MNRFTNEEFNYRRALQRQFYVGIFAIHHLENRSRMHLHSLCMIYTGLMKILRRLWAKNLWKSNWYVVYYLHFLASRYVIEIRFNHAM